MTTTKDEMRIVELCDELEKTRRYYCELDDYRKVQIATTIERCAQVAERYAINIGEIAYTIAAELRALKDKQ